MYRTFSKKIHKEVASCWSCYVSNSSRCLLYFEVIYFYLNVGSCEIESFEILGAKEGKTQSSLMTEHIPPFYSTLLKNPVEVLKDDK